MKRIERIKQERKFCLEILCFRITFFTVILTLFGLIGIVLLSCAPKPKILPQNITPENVLRCILNRQIEFETFACLVDLKLKGKEEKFSGNIEYYFQAPSTFAFYPRTILGVDVFKASGEDDSLTIYFPRNNEYYSGNFSDLQKTQAWSWKISLEMLQDIILGRGGLVEKNAVYTGISEDMFQYKFEDGDWIKEYWINPQRCRLMKSQFTRKKEGDSYQIEYRSFVSYNQAEIPKAVKIKSLSNESAQIRFLERKFNLSIPDKKFKIQIPPDARRVTFETSAK